MPLAKTLQQLWVDHQTPEILTFVRNLLID